MLQLTFDEWLATLPNPDREKAKELLRKLYTLGATDPETWVRSEVSEDLAQFARYLVLRGVWPDHIDTWARAPEEWIGRLTSANDKPDRYFSEARQALSKALAAGVSVTELGAIARVIAYETAFGVLNRIDEGYDPTAGDDAPGWALMETGADGSPTGRSVGGLHEDLLSMDPIGREGKS